MDVAYLIVSKVTGLYLKPNFGQVEFMAGQTKKKSQAVIFETKEDLEKFWIDRLLISELFKLEEI